VTNSNSNGNRSTTKCRAKCRVQVVQVRIIEVRIIAVRCVGAGGGCGGKARPGRSASGVRGEVAAAPPEVCGVECHSWRVEVPRKVPRKVPRQQE